MIPLYFSRIKTLSKNCFDIIEKFHQCSGLKLNYTKTEILPIDTDINLDDLEVKVVQKAQSLGITYYDNIDTIIEENYVSKLNDLEKTISSWRKRNLTIMGKNTVIKTLIVPKINFLVSNLYTPGWFVDQAQTLIQNFLWNDKKPKIKMKTIYGTTDDGGLRFPNLDLLVKAQKVAWVKRMTCNKNAAWMQLLYTVLPKLQLKHILKCTIHPERLAEYIPSFYRQILYAWFELRPYPQTALDIRRQMLWYNKYILIDKMPTFNKIMYKAGICSINNLLDHEGKILKYENLNIKYNIRIDMMYYMSLIDAIPIEWRQMLKTCNFPLDIINNNENPHMLINDQFKDISQVKSKEIYLAYLKLHKHEANCIDAWNERLSDPIPMEDWKYIFTLTKKTVTDTRILSMQYKIIHRCYATNSTICKWDETKEETCSTCKQKANIMHNFVTCTTISAFWNYIFNHLQTYNIESPQTLNANDILFGKYVEAKYDMLNHLILYGKYYIHKHFVQNKIPHPSNFFYYYHQTLLIEKERYVEKDQLKTFNQRFGKSTLIDFT